MTAVEQHPVIGTHPFGGNTASRSVAFDKRMSSGVTSLLALTSARSAASNFCRSVAAGFADPSPRASGLMNLGTSRAC